MTNPPTLSVLIVNLNGGNMLRACVEALLRQTLAPTEVIVVDNGSTDQSWDLSVFKEQTHYSLIRLDRNAGFSEANNIAYAASIGEYIVLLNNDVELEEHWLEKMTAAAAPDSIGSVACHLRQKQQPQLIDSVGFDLYFNGSTQTAYGLRAESLDPTTVRPFGPVASAALYKRKAIETTGTLFHEPYFAYYEDTDLAMRLRLRGWDVAYAHEAIGWHVGSATGKRKSAFHGYHLRRNIEYLFWVNFSLRHQLLYFLPFVFCETLAGLEMLCRGNGRAFLRAKRDALRHLSWIRQERNLISQKANPRERLEMEKRCKGILLYFLGKFWLPKPVKPLASGRVS
jgi:GT2 family glycosyltransferase